MKETIEYIGFGNILTIASVIGSMVWHASRFNSRIEKLEEKTEEHKVLLSEIRSIREWQIERDAKEGFAKAIVDEFSKFNKAIVEALQSLKVGKN